MMEKNGAIYTGFITQAGNLKIWKEPSLIENEAYLSISLKDVFWASLVSDGEYFYALSKNGTVYRVSLDGEVLAVQIPNATAQEGVLSVVKVDGSSESNIYVGIDGNLIYGFNKNLEILTGFPVVGSKKPVFADGNGDGKAECITLSIDNKLYMWNLR